MTEDFHSGQSDIDSELDRFRVFVCDHFGLSFDSYKLADLAEVLVGRSRQNSVSPAEYLELLNSERLPGELKALAENLTVGETYFFRQSEQFRAFGDVVLAEQISAGRQTKVLCAGCSSGEEAYTLAICAGEIAAGLPPIAITAVDINPRALEKAAAARYSAWSLRETTAEMRRRHFKQAGRDFMLDKSLTSMVNFSEFNLAQPESRWWPPGTFNTVFCRNVLMYFAPENARALISNIARVLAPGGYLFLGHAETLRGISRDFELCHTHGTFYYRRLPRPAAGAPLRAEARPAAGNRAAEPLSAVLAGSDSWVDAIRRASERIDALTRAGRETADGSAPAGGFDLSMPLELLRLERYEEALELLSQLPPESESDTDVRLLSAVLQSHRGELAQAEYICRGLIAAGELSAGAHYVLALCREAAGDLAGAINCDKTAAYLDPGFSMPRLHLGLLACRANDSETARRELTQALTLLQSEDSSRLLLFGGGFSREALSALCRAQLAACGRNP